MTQLKKETCQSTCGGHITYLYLSLGGFFDDGGFDDGGGFDMGGGDFGGDMDFGGGFDF